VGYPLTHGKFTPRTPLRGGKKEKSGRLWLASGKKMGRGLPSIPQSIAQREKVHRMRQIVLPLLLTVSIPVSIDRAAEGNTGPYGAAGVG